MTSVTSVCVRPGSADLLFLPVSKESRCDEDSENFPCLLHLSKFHRCKHVYDLPAREGAKRVAKLLQVPGTAKFLAKNFSEIFPATGIGGVIPESGCKITAITRHGQIFSTLFSRNFSIFPQCADFKWIAKTPQRKTTTGLTHYYI